MQFDELWIILVKKNINLQEVEDSTVTMTVRGFKKALKLAYEQGLSEGSQNKKQDFKDVDFFTKMFNIK